MRISTLVPLIALLMNALGLSSASAATEYSLRPELDSDATATVSVSLVAGGELLVSNNGQVQSQPMNVLGELRYHERLVSWSADATEVTRSVRHYESATASIKSDQRELKRDLTTEKSNIVAEIRGGRLALNALAGPLTRHEFDLVNVSGSSLALDRLLPNKKVAEGENWQHEIAVIAPLLGMDHVAVCEVSSVVTGESHEQVQIRLAGTVHGTIDGAPTEIELRGAYLFHLDLKRISKFNLAIKEKRTASELVPGLDIVAQIKMVVTPAKRADQLSRKLVAAASDISRPLRPELLFDGGKHGFRLLHDTSWYIRGEQSDLISFGHLHEGQMTAHCNVATLPARSEGRETTLEQFELDVRESLGDNLQKVTAARKWNTERGNSCLGIVAAGKVNDVPMQWRYYLVSSPDKPRVTLSVTVEESFVKEFADADRQLVDSLELGTYQKPNSTASKSTGTTK